MPVRVLLCLLAALAAPLPALAQVGHPPGESPYRGIVDGHSITPQVGYLGGSGGKFGAGPHGGLTYGFRYDLRAGRTTQLGIGVGRAMTERIIVDPFVRLDERFSAPVAQALTTVDVHAQLNLTGGKTWNGLAPFAALGVGLAFAEATPADTSGYDFGTKILIAPAAGVRWFLTPALHLRADVRGVFWRLNYPSSYAAEPVEEPGTPEEPNAVIPEGSLNEWTLTPWLQLGVGYAFRW